MLRFRRGRRERLGFNGFVGGGIGLGRGFGYGLRCGHFVRGCEDRCGGGLGGLAEQLHFALFTAVKPAGSGDIAFVDQLDECEFVIF